MMYKILLQSLIIALVNADLYDPELYEKMQPKGYQGEFDDMSCDELKNEMSKTHAEAYEQQDQLEILIAKKKKRKQKNLFYRITDFIQLKHFQYPESTGNHIYEDSYEHTVWLNPDDYGGIRRIKIVAGFWLLAHRIQFEWESPGYDMTFRFTDNTGDVYWIWCIRSGEHYLDYNSADPRIVRVDW